MRTPAIVLLVLLLCGGAAGTISWQQKRIDALTLDRDGALQMANDSGRVAHTYVNLFGQEVNRNHALSATVSNLKALRGTEETKWMKAFEGLRANYSNLEAGIRAQAEAQIYAAMTRKKDTTIIIDGDTLSIRHYEYKDQFNQIIADSYPGDSLIVEGAIQVPVDAVIYWQREKKFLWFRVGKKLYYSEMTSPNLWVKIKSHEVLRVQRK